MQTRVRTGWLLAVLALCGATPPGNAVEIDWTFVGHPGNRCDEQIDGCFGAVDYDYQIGTYEVTIAQYTEFLNAKAASDPLGLYNMSMAAGAYIYRSGSVGSFTYSVGLDHADMPVMFVSVYDAMRFANWLNNGKGSADTETGAYTLLGGTPTPSNGATVVRNAGATVFLASEDEWYKAAYFDALPKSYFAYPAGSDTQTTCAPPTATANRANCSSAMGASTAKGSYPGSPSPSGTFDQGGNVWEWNEAIVDGSERGIRGASWNGGFPWFLAASARNSGAPDFEGNDVGFRVAPEPGTGLLRLAGVAWLFALVRWRTQRLRR